jgi:chromate transporter
MIDPARLFWLILRATLFSTGGSGNVPILYNDLRLLGYATEQQFAEALAIGQVTPGPTGLWVVSLGYLIDGVRGALLATAAVTLPPLLILVVERLYRRVGTHWAVQGFLRGLGLAVAGSFAIVIMGLVRGSTFDLSSMVIVVASIGLAATRRVPVPLIIAGAALLGVALYR